jgi:asparagine synthetase B (glutamine-hydrolysing)
MALSRYWRYWEHEPGRRTTSTEELRQALLAAVRQRAPRGRTGVVLSGGLDSSSVAGALAAGSPEPVFLYTNQFRAAASLDESVFFDDVVAATGGVARRIESDEHWALRDVPQPSRQPAEPHQGWFYRQEREVALAAERDGVVALLDGTGGDELFQPGFHGGSFSLGHAACLPDRRARLRFLAELRAGRRTRDPLSCLVVRNDITPPFLSPLLVRTAPPRDYLADTVEAMRLLDLDAVTAMRVFMLECTNQVRDDRCWLDRELFGPVGIRRRQPLLDSRVIEAVFRFPVSELVSACLSKPVLRRLMAGFLPDVVLRRKHKVTFEAILRRGIGPEGRELDRVRRLMSGAVVFEMDLVDPSAFRHYFEDVYLADRYDRLRIPALKYWIWQVLVLEIWLRGWVGDRPEEPGTCPAP